MSTELFGLALQGLEIQYIHSRLICKQANYMWSVNDMINTQKEFSRKKFLTLVQTNATSSATSWLSSFST